MIEIRRLMAWTFWLFVIAGLVMMGANFAHADSNQMIINEGYALHCTISPADSKPGLHPSVNLYIMPGGEHIFAPQDNTDTGVLEAQPIYIDYKTTYAKFETPYRNKDGVLVDIVMEIVVNMTTLDMIMNVSAASNPSDVLKVHGTCEFHAGMGTINLR